MAKKMAKPTTVSGVAPKMDFARIKRIYQNDLACAKSNHAASAQEMSTAYKEIQRECHVMGGAAKAAFTIYEMEDHRRDDYLRGMFGILKEMGATFTPELVDQAQEFGIPAAIIPDAAPPKPRLVTVPATPVPELD